MIVCINFYGLTRNALNITLPSIRNNIFKPLTDAGVKYEIYLHTYNLKVLNLKRSREKNIRLNINEWKQLMPHYWKITSQEQFDRSYDYKKIEKYGDVYRTNFQNIYGLIRQLNSIKIVKSLWNKPYDYYLFLRPDLLYNDKLDIGILNIKHSLITAQWGSNGGHNDRFAFGTHDVITIWANRLDRVLQYCQTTGRSLHAERFLKFICDTPPTRVNVIKIGMRASRVRANGRVIDFGNINLIVIRKPKPKPKPKRKPRQIHRNIIVLKRSMKIIK